MNWTADRELIISVTAIICLTILGIFIISYMPGASELVYTIVVIISGIAGFYIPRAVARAIVKIRRK